MSAELLTTSTVREHLLRRGIVEDGPVEVSVLAGGVSNIVLAVDAGDRHVVVKQALERLRVTETWTAPRSRILHEAAALRAVAALTPDAVPGVLDVDPESMTLVIERAPLQWEDWRSVLMRGEADRAVAHRLGDLLAGWHRDTQTCGPGVSFDDGAETFEALRIDPFHRAVARRRPELARAVDDVVARMSATRRCLVHGDFSPKNILIAPDGGGLWVIDFEVVHRGDPTFDLAFLLAHLHLKAINVPQAAHRYDAAAAAFLAAYRETGLRENWEDERYLLAQVGCLLLARVLGKSPAGYLDATGRTRAQEFGRALLLGEIGSLDEAAERRDGSLV